MRLQRGGRMLGDAAAVGGIRGAVRGWQSPGDWGQQLLPGLPGLPGQEEHGHADGQPDSDPYWDGRARTARGESSPAPTLTPEPSQPSPFHLPSLPPHRLPPSRSTTHTLRCEWPRLRTASTRCPAARCPRPAAPLHSCCCLLCGPVSNRISHHQQPRCPILSLTISNPHPVQP